MQTKNLKVIRDALEEISVSGRRNIVLMNLCMEALEAEIRKQTAEAETENKEEKENG